MPSNIRMLLASAKESETVDNLADEIKEIATPGIPSIDTTSLSAEVKRLRTKISTLKTPVQSCATPVRTNHAIVPPVQDHLTLLLVIAGTTLILAIKPPSVLHHATSLQEMTRPNTYGGRPT